MLSRRVVLRAAVTVGALAYAAAAIGNGIDRLAPIWPDTASNLPALFATDALEVAAAVDLARNPRAAAGVAAKLVARAPIEPYSTALLGASLAAIGDEAGADRAFRVAGQLGWRIPLTQSYWLTAALAVGDPRIGAQHLDALLRQRPDLLGEPELTAPFETDNAARSALVDRLATRPPWLDQYASANVPVLPATIIARRVPVLMMLGDRGVILGCAVIAPAVAQLAGARLTAQAEALRHRHCADR